jgi:hypothetical protein
LRQITRFCGPFLGLAVKHIAAVTADFLPNLIAYDLIRIPKLLAA